MIHIKRFNESISNFKELEFDDDMMIKTSAVINLINFKEDDKVYEVIKKSLDDEVYRKLFKDLPSKYVVNYFITTVINHKMLKKMFSNVVVHEGSDEEDEYVSALEINGRIVLILCSPERGSMIRIEDNNYSITFEEVLEIFKFICEIYNDRLI
jgi:hypothetical protein